MFKPHDQQEQCALRIRFVTNTEAGRYGCALVSLLFGASTQVSATLATGASMDNLVAKEIADRLARGAVHSLRFSIRLGEHAVPVDLALLASNPADVVIRARFMSGRAISRLWLQSDEHVQAPIAALALPITSVALAVDAAHAFVGLALRCGGFEGAELTGERPISWTQTKPGDGGQPVFSSFRDAVWSTRTQAGGAGALWVAGLPPAPQPRTPEPG